MSICSIRSRSRLAPGLRSHHSLLNNRLPSYVFLCVLALFLVEVAPAAAQRTEADVSIARAILSYEAKRYDEALQLLHEALAIEPNHVEALYYMGVVLNVQQKPKEAMIVLEKAYGLDPTDRAIKFQLGATYFALQQYAKAEPLLTEVFLQEPQTENLGYYVGFMRYRQKDYQGAVQAFRKGVATDPQIQQLSRFYSGLALAIVGLPQEAATELEEASRIRTVSPLTAPADRLRDTLLATQEAGRRLHMELRVGAYYDTNISITPLSNSDPLVADLRARRSHTPGELASGRLEYAWYRGGPWEATVTGVGFKTQNNELPFFNVGNYLGGTGLAYRGAVASLPFQVSGQYTYDSTTLHSSDFLNRHSGTLTGTLVENAGNLTSLLGRLQVKDFSNEFLIGGGGLPQENRDANNWLLGITHVFRFANDRHFIRVGYQYDIEDAKGSDWFYRGYRALVGAQYTLPWWEMRVHYDFDFYYRKYPHPNAVFPQTAPNTVRQEVREQNHIFRIELPLPHNFTLAADFQATLSRSNLPEIFNYNRTISTLSLAWGF